jgi:spermidine/putrescine-binding protein
MTRARYLSIGLALLFTVALALLIRPGRAAAAEPGELNLYIWTEYLPQTVLDEFTRRTGIKVNVDNYDSNETLLAKLQSGVAGYDLCVPSDYMIEVLISEKLIQPIDKAKVPNLSNVDARFLKRPFDPDNAYTVPYLWGTTGFAYNKKAVPGKVDSWAVVFDEKYAGKILMLDDVRECFAAALKSMGKPLNSNDEASLRAAGDLLKKQKKLVKTYNSDDFDNVLASGDVVIAQGYNGQLAKLATAQPDDFAYVVPKEGCTVAMDGMCIPSDAKNVEAAHLFLNFIHEPQINAQIVNGVNYASTNAKAKAFVNKEILNNPAIYPSEAELANCEFMADIGGDATELMDRLWTEIKAE